MSPLVRLVDSLQRAFEQIARTRMADLPLNNPQLDVATVDFRAEDGGDFALGVLVTPWCMNLLRLPLRDGVEVLGVGSSGPRDIGTRRFHFIGVHEPLALYHDPRFALQSALKFQGLPATILYDRQGREVARVSGEASAASSSVAPLTSSMVSTRRAERSRTTAGM